MKRILFILEIYLVKRVLKRTKNLFNYPVCISLTFEREWYWERYKRGRSVKSSVDHKVNLMVQKARRQRERTLTPALLQRYESFCESVRFNRELREAFGKDPELERLWKS